MSESIENNQYEAKIKLIVLSLNVNDDTIRTKFRRLQGIDLAIVTEKVSEQTGHMNFLEALKIAVTVAVDNDEDFVCIGTENCSLEENFDCERLIKYIRLAASFGAKLLMGNIGSYDEGVYCGKNLYWVNSFENTNFFIVTRTFYKTILSMEIDPKTSIWNALSAATSNKFVLFPFISKNIENNKAKDATQSSEQTKETQQRLELLRRITTRYKKK